MPPNLPPTSPPQLPEPLTLDGLIRTGVLAELARLFQAPATVDRLLDPIDFPHELRPNIASFPNPEECWRQVCRMVEGGATAAGLSELLAAAADIYPYNRVFRPFARIAPTSSPTDGGTARNPSLSVTTRRPASEVVAVVRRLAAEHRLPGTAQVEAATDTGLTVFGFDEATLDQVERLADAVRAAFTDATTGSAARVSVAAGGNRSVLLDRLFLESPDGSRFELSDVPASTTPRDIARAVMAEYAAAEEPPGRPPEAAVGVLLVLPVAFSAELLAAARMIAGTENVAVEFASRTATVLHLPAHAMDTGWRAGRDIAAWVRADPDAVIATTSAHRDTILRDLLTRALGQLAAAPAGTGLVPDWPVMEKLLATRSEWSPPRPPEPARHRPVVVDHLRADGTAVRLDPDRPIGEQGVFEGDRLEVQPESRAA